MASSSGYQKHQLSGAVQTARVNRTNLPDHLSLSSTDEIVERLSRRARLLQEIQPSMTFWDLIRLITAALRGSPVRNFPLSGSRRSLRPVVGKGD